MTGPRYFPRGGRQICDRCGTQDIMLKESWFTEEQLCCVCVEEETGLPDYEEAFFQKHRGGRGIGLSSHDIGTLRKYRSERYTKPPF